VSESERTQNLKATLSVLCSIIIISPTPLGFDFGRDRVKRGRLEPLRRGGASNLSTGARVGYRWFATGNRQERSKREGSAGVELGDGLPLSGESPA
jgi:hypothetical protein